MYTEICGKLTVLREGQNATNKFPHQRWSFLFKGGQLSSCRKPLQKGLVIKNK